jgi:hypothetical protein
MRITKRVREEAALFCTAVACSGDFDLFDIDYMCSLGISDPGRKLANRALTVACSLPTDWSAEMWREDWAEAEALLRTGWTP